MTDIKLKDTEARGRNGWFRADHFTVEVVDDEIYPVWLDVFSKRPTYPGPIHLEMSLEDVQALVVELRKAMGEAHD